MLLPRRDRSDDQLCLSRGSWGGGGGGGPGGGGGGGGVCNLTCFHAAHLYSQVVHEAPHLLDGNACADVLSPVLPWSAIREAWLGLLQLPQHLAKMR